MSDGNGTTQATEDRLAQLGRLREAWLDNRTTRQFVQIAEELRRLGDAAGAAELLETGLEAHPRYLSAQVALGRCRLELGQAAPACELLEKVVEVDSTHPLATRLLIEAYLALGDYDRAREKLELYRLLNASDPQIDLLEAGLEQAAGGAAAGEPAAPATMPPASAAAVSPAPTGNVEAVLPPRAAGAETELPPDGESETRPGLRSPLNVGRSSSRRVVWETTRHRGLAAPFLVPGGSRPLLQRAPLDDAAGALTAPFGVVVAVPVGPEAQVALEVSSERSGADGPSLNGGTGLAEEPREVQQEVASGAPAAEVAVPAEPVAEVSPEAIESGTDPVEEEELAGEMSLLPTPPVGGGVALEGADPEDSREDSAPQGAVSAEPEEPVRGDDHLPHSFLNEVEAIDSEDPTDLELGAANEDGNQPEQGEAATVEAAPLDDQPVLVVAGHGPLSSAPPRVVAEAGPVATETTTLGLLYLRQGHSREAERIFRRVLDREPANDTARDGLRRAMIEVDLARGGADSSPPRGITERKVQRLGGWLGRLGRG